MRRRLILSIAVSCLPALLATGCGGIGGSAGSKTISVAYQDFGTFHAAGQLFKKITPVFEKEHPGWKVKLVPIEAPENDYYTKLDLMNRAPDTAPDLMYEDTFLINSDARAGYLAPMNSYVNSWPDWAQFYPASKQGVQSQKGTVYGVPMSTDARGLWYNKQIFARAGVPVPWHPKTWADVLSAARAIKQKVPGVIPLQVYSGTPAGEAATMQGYEMLLYGTGETLYNHANNKWIAPGAGFTSAMNFVKTVYQQGLGPSPQQELNPNIATIVPSQWIPKGKLAINLDGSWLPGENWTAGNATAWPQWSQVMGWTTMPTENGQAPGLNTLSGGWALSIGANSPSKAMDWDFAKLATSAENSLYFVSHSGDLTVRKDVASNPAFLNGRPDIKFWTSLIPYTQYRPAYVDYPRLSNQIQQSMESVMTGQQSPQQATAAYGQALNRIVQPSNVQGS
jgi:multiple sugar transport system substrate-binding protein